MRAKTHVSRWRAGAVAWAAAGAGAVAVFAACSSGRPGGGSCGDPFVSSACDSCASTACGGSLNALCGSSASSSYCGCVSGGTDPAACADSTIQSHCTGSSACPFASCLVASCGSVCGVTSSLTTSCTLGSSGGGSGGGPGTCTKNLATGTLTGDGFTVAITNAPVWIALMQASPPLVTFTLGASAKQGTLSGATGLYELGASVNLDGNGLGSTGAGTFTLGAASPQDSLGDVAFTDTVGTTNTVLGASSATPPAKSDGAYTITINGSGPSPACGGAIVGAMRPMTGGSLTATLIDGMGGQAALSLTW